MAIRGRIGTYVPTVESKTPDGFIGAYEVGNAAATGGGGGGGGGSGGGNSIRAFPEPNSGRAFPTNASRTFPKT